MCVVCVRGCLDTRVVNDLTSVIHKDQTMTAQFLILIDTDVRCELALGQIVPFQSYSQIFHTNYVYFNLYIRLSEI